MSLHNNLQKNGHDLLARAATLSAALVSVCTILLLLFFLLHFSANAVKSISFTDAFSLSWQPFKGQYGLLAMIAGSVLLASFAMSLAMPAGIAICAIIHGIGGRTTAKIFKQFLSFMTGIPTVIYSFVSVMILVPLVRKISDTGTGFSLFSATLPLALQSLPVIALVLDAHISQIANRLKPVTCSMGLPASVSFFAILLPSASKSIWQAGILGFGRALGDTLIALMVAGNAPQLPNSVFSSIRTLTSHIALVVSTDSSSKQYASVFTAGLLLFICASLINVTAHYLAQVRHTK